MKYLTKDCTGIQVKYTLNEPFQSSGSISIIGRKIECNDSDLFMIAVNTSDNMEVYPKIDETVQMNFAFSGLTKEISKIGGENNE